MELRVRRDQPHARPDWSLKAGRAWQEGCSFSERTAVIEAIYQMLAQQMAVVPRNNAAMAGFAAGKQELESIAMRLLALEHWEQVPENSGCQLTVLHLL